LPEPLLYEGPWPSLLIDNEFILPFPPFAASFLPHILSSGIVFYIIDTNKEPDPKAMDTIHPTIPSPH